MSVGCWNASFDTRRRKLRRYGRGPKRKPPEPPDPPAPPPKGGKSRIVPSSHRTSLGNNYSCCRRPCSSPLYADNRRLVAPFIACSRRPFNRVSPSYYYHYRPLPSRHGNRHGVSKKGLVETITTKLRHFLKTAKDTCVKGLTYGKTFFTYGKTLIFSSLTTTDTESHSSDTLMPNMTSTSDISLNLPTSPPTNEQFWHIPLLHFKKAAQFMRRFALPEPPFTSSSLPEKAPFGLSLSSLKSRATALLHGVAPTPTMNQAKFTNDNSTVSIAGCHNCQCLDHLIPRPERPASNTHHNPQHFRQRMHPVSQLLTPYVNSAPTHQATCLPCFLPSIASAIPFDSSDISALTEDTSTIMSAGIPESTLNDSSGRGTTAAAAQPPPTDNVSRSELTAILNANNTAIIAAMQQQFGTANVSHNTGKDSDTATHGTASTGSTSASYSTTASKLPTKARTPNVSRPDNTDEAASVSRAQAMRANFRNKYVSDDSTTAPTPAARENGIPIGARCTLQSVDEAQYVEFSTYTSHVAKADPDAEVTALAAAEIARICLTTMDPSLAISVVRAVERAPVEGPSNKNNAKLHGYFVLQLDSHRDDTAAFRGQLLRDTIQQFVVQQFHTLLSDDSDMPKFARALRFKLAPVNTDEIMPLGLVGGLLADDLDDFDVTAQELLLHSMIEEADICLTDEHGLPTHPVFSTKASIRKNLGILFYTTSTVTTNRRNGRAIAVGYATTEEGEEAARIFADSCEGKSLSVYSGIHVTFARFPSRGQRGKKSKEDPVRTFVKNHVTKNVANCGKHYSTHTIENVTAVMYDEDVIDSITSRCSHVLGVIPRVMRGAPPEGEAFRMKITVVVHKNGATCLKDSNYYRRTFMTDHPLLFPPSATDDFVKVSNKKKAAVSNGTQAKANKPITTSWEQNLDNNFKAVKESTGPYAVGWDKGGRGCVGLKKHWYGPGGAKECTNRVSGSVYYKVPSEAAGMSLLQKWYEINDMDELEEFHKNVPHNETNLWPTWSLSFQDMPQRFGAKEYTWVEHDDDEVYAARLNATTFYTGSAEGVITNRNQLTKAKPSDFYKSDDVSSDGEDDGAGSGNNDDVNEYDDDPAPNSQSFFNDNDPGGKRRRCRTPSPKNSPFTNTDWAVIVNPSIITTCHDLHLHSKCFPGYSKLTGYEFVVCSVPWDLTDRTTMAVFAVDEATAHSYAHWVEHTQPIFNVPVRTVVRSPALKSNVRQMESNMHAESMATSDLTHYVKCELPLHHHLDFSKHIQWCNHPTALITKLITEWKCIERIKDINTAKASPKGAADFDATMTDAMDEEVGNSFDGPSMVAAAAATVAAATDRGTETCPSTSHLKADDDENSIGSIDLLLDADTDLLP
eukprot:scaffold72577_cov50-Cyclotella_meneghiniana.AAC.3